jgi:hypothetical protein
MFGLPVGVGALVDVGGGGGGGGGGGAGVLVGVGGLLRPPVSWEHEEQLQRGSRMPSPKDDTACYGDGGDSNENESCKNKEPRLRDATDSALSVGSNLF